MKQTVMWEKLSSGRITGIERVKIKFSDPLSVESLSFNSDSEDSSWALEYYGTIDRTLSDQEWEIKCHHWVMEVNTIQITHQLYLVRRNEKWTGYLDSRPLSFDKTSDYVDISSTPLTNYFPIRAIEEGGSKYKYITALYVQVPSLKVSFVEQYYEKIKQNEYAYKAVGSNRQYTIKTDKDNLTQSYDKLWERFTL